MRSKIMASKLYKTSKFKNKIDSAIADPFNKKLIMQLSSYLGEDSDDYTIDGEAIDSDIVDGVAGEGVEDAVNNDTELENSETVEFDDAESELIDLKSRIVSPKLSSIDKNEILDILKADPSTGKVKDITVSDISVKLIYPEDVELSSLIVPVIELFESSRDPYIENLRFVKLSRANNAMVFNYEKG